MCMCIHVEAKQVLVADVFFHLLHFIDLYFLGQGLIDPGAL